MTNSHIWNRLLRWALPGDREGDGCENQTGASPKKENPPPTYDSLFKQSRTHPAATTSLGWIKRLKANLNGPGGRRNGNGRQPRRKQTTKPDQTPFPRTLLPVKSCNFSGVRFTVEPCKSTCRDDRTQSTALDQTRPAGKKPVAQSFIESGGKWNCKQINVNLQQHRMIRVSGDGGGDKSEDRLCRPGCRLNNVSSGFFRCFEPGGNLAFEVSVNPAQRHQAPWRVRRGQMATVTMDTYSGEVTFQVESGKLFRFGRNGGRTSIPDQHGEINIVAAPHSSVSVTRHGMGFLFDWFWNEIRYRGNFYHSYGGRLEFGIVLPVKVQGGGPVERELSRARELELCIRTGKGGLVVGGMDRPCNGRCIGRESELRAFFYQRLLGKLPALPRCCTGVSSKKIQSRDSSSAPSIQWSC